MYRARVERTPTVTFGAPEVIYAADIDGINNWDLHPDGNRFVVIVPEGTSLPQRGGASEATRRYLVTLNWFDELRRELGGRQQ